MLVAYVFLLTISYSLAERDERDPKFSIFQIIKFENAACNGTDRSGVCFTESECDSMGGTGDGSCADGFGVCCIKLIDKDGSSSMNNSHIVAIAADVTAGSSCTYTVCPTTESICRIRFDFTGFVLSAPALGSTNAGTQAAATGVSTDAVQIGDCNEDQFSITSPVSSGTPVICGTNTGQHMILDSDGVSCSNVNFGIGSATFARSWNIAVTQFNCGDEMGGPAGCLQWFTTATGTLRSFNFPEQAAAAAVATTVVHLSNQHYKACIRRPLGANRICYPPCTNVDPTTGQSSFGVSRSPDAAAKSAQGTDCSDDYIAIPGGQTTANAATGTLSLVSHFCGRELRPTRNEAYAADSAYVCTASVPFEVTVHFDENEAFTANTDASTYDQGVQPGGITGFSLCYTTA